LLHRAFVLVIAISSGLMLAIGLVAGDGSFVVFGVLGCAVAAFHEHAKRNPDDWHGVVTSKTYPLGVMLVVMLLMDIYRRIGLLIEALA
jgi:hypothetical protein